MHGMINGVVELGSQCPLAHSLVQHCNLAGVFCLSGGHKFKLTNSVFGKNDT